MLIYHPAFDAYHCTIRIVALLVDCKRLDVEKARILDFYLAFPSAMQSMRLPAELASLRAMLRQMDNVYRDPVSPKRTFAEMRHVQLAALGCLAAADIIDGAKLPSGIVERTNKPLPSKLEAAITNFMADENEVMQLLATKVAEMPTAGPNGLKDRSGLLEYRYDAV